MDRRSTPNAAEPHMMRFEYKRMPRPIFFPVEEKVPESTRHLALRTLLHVFLTRAFRAHAAIGSDQFVYFRATDPKRCVAPDAFVRLGAEHEHFGSWKIWERGAPDVAVEIVSDHERAWEDKLADYAEVGVRELVRFDADAKKGARLRVWDRVEGDLVERVVTADCAESLVLGGTWCVAPSDDLPVSLRLADASGALLPTDAEAERARAAAEGARADAEGARADAEGARADAAEARAKALEARLAALEAERGEGER